MSNGLTPNQLKILTAMKSNSRIIYVELAEIVGIATTNIARNVKKLAEKKIICRIGSPKSGYWVIIKTDL